MRLRQRFAYSLRDRLAGSEQTPEALAIYSTPGERWFSPGDPICVVHDDAAMLIGGLRALLLQALHPLAMAGVAGHSGYRSDPWGRLQRTNRYIGVTTFGLASAAEDLIATINQVHQRVRGKAADGRPYRASDPHLLAWIHAAEADSFLTSYRLYGQRPTLSAADQDRYVAQIGEVSARLGVREPPTTVAELTAVIESYRPELDASEACLDTVSFLLDEPPLEAAAKPGYRMLSMGALAALPVWARELLGIGLNGQATDLVDRRLRRPIGRLATKAVQWGLDDPSVLDIRRHPAMKRAVAAAQLGGASDHPAG